MITLFVNVTFQYPPVPIIATFEFKKARPFISTTTNSRQITYLSAVYSFFKTKLPIILLFCGEMQKNLNEKV